LITISPLILAIVRRDFVVNEITEHKGTGKF
jgi:hypothetical protein